MGASTKVITGPVTEPVTLAEAKAHLNVTIPDDDNLIENLIRAARRKLEWEYRRAFVTQTLQLSMDYFGQPEFVPTWMYGWPPSMLSYGPTGWMQATASVIELRPPVSSIVSVTYVDPAGVVQTLASSGYYLDGSSEPGRLVPALGKVWPVTGPLPGAVKIQYATGAASSDLVTDDIKAAVRLYLGELYQNREDVIVDTRIVALAIPDGVDALMAPYRFWLVR